MNLTKTQAKIMQVFTGHIEELFSIRGIGKKLKMNHSLTHRAIKPLIEKYKLLTVNKQNFISLNFRKNHNILTNVEYMRRDLFLNKPRNKYLAMCLDDFVKNFKEESFVLLIFGSAINTNNPADIDILLFVDDIKKTDSSKLELYNISRNYELEDLLHIVSISYESVYEMLGLREQINVMNELLNKHIIIYGAELFYRLLTRGRK